LGGGVFCSPKFSKLGSDLQHKYEAEIGQPFALPKWFQVLENLLCFKTTAPQMRNLGQILHFFDPL